MKTIFKLSDDLYKVVIIKVNFFLGLVACSNVDLTIGEAEVVGGFAVEISFDGEGLEDEGSLKACTDVDDGVVGE